ncbi:MAG: TatD family hydrolase [Parcubacteria group bacterium]|nr:TatD family hydrolase [Parcubacteria group bacterium]
MIIDSHCHLQFKAYDEDREEVIKRNLAENVWMVNVGTRYDTSRTGVELAERYDGLFATVGVHPIHATKPDSFDSGEVGESAAFEEINWSRLEELAQHSKVVGIGETGLDFWRLDQKSPAEQEEIKRRQKEVFLGQISLAKKLNRPIVIHCRAAYEEVLEILEQEKDLRGVAHFFSGRLSQAKRLLDLSFYLSFAGPITYVRDYDKVILEVPIERLLLETDAPYATPAPYRGERNEPRYAKYIAEKLAELKGVSLEEIIDATTANAKKLFRIN